MFTMPENWSTLTSQEKMEVRFKSWMSRDMKFASPEAAKGYKERIQMIKDVTDLKNVQ